MIYIGTDGGIYRWYEGSPWPVFHSLQDKSIISLAALAGGAMAAADSAGGVWQTANNGLDWRPIALPPWNEGVTALAMGGGNVAVATRAAGLYRRAAGTVEGWTPMASPTAATQGPAPRVRTLVAGPALFAAVVGDGLWRSGDGGQAWTRCEGLPGEMYSVRTPTKPAGTVLAGTADGVWSSADGGQSWARLGTGLEKLPHVAAVEVSPEDPKYLLAGVAPAAPDSGAAAPREGLGFALYESKDAGKTWGHVRRGFPEGLESDAITDIRFDPAAPDYAVVALGSGELWRTRNGGDWFEPLARQIRAARVLCVV